VNRAIAWFAENHVAANLLMMAIIIAGLLSAPYIKQSVWPDFEINYVSATVVYPGASPEDVEKSVTIRIEEEIEGVEGIVDVTSSANEGATNVSVELEDGADLGRALDHIEARIDGITTLPKETEEPVVSDVKFSGQVLDIAIYGAADERTLTRIGQKVRDDIAKLPGVTNVELAAVRPYEISIEVSERELQRRGLRFDDVVLAIRRSSLDLPGGSVKTQAGEILLRTEGQAYRRVEFERIPLLTARDGSRVTVGDVAEVKDGFEETGKYARFDGQPAVFVQVFRVGDQQALEIAARVRAYIETARLWLPAGITLTVWDDDSLYLADRIGMMLRNAAGGFVLVLVLLAVFLKLRVAFWVAMGVPVSVCGALALMSPLGIDINILTVFSFIMALGILVDDAIVTGENIYTHQERQPGDPLGASIRGTQEVATPVVFGVLTTIAAFAPFTMVGGHARFMALGISGVMMVALGFSLVESKLVLPSHLAHFGGGPPPRRRISKAWARFQSRVAKRLRAFTEGVYGPAVRACVEWRYLTAAVSFGCFIVCLSLAQSGHVKSSMAPTMQADSVRAQLTMPLGTPTEQTEGAVAQLEAAAVRLTRELDEMSEPEEPSMLLHTLTTLGQHHGTSVASGRRVATGRTHLGQVTLELSASEERSLTASDIADRWRELTGSIPGVEEITFVGAFKRFGDPINVELGGDDLDELQAAADAVIGALSAYPGVFDIRDSNRDGKRQLKLGILPEAEAQGLTLEDLGRQVRQAFYGAEAQRIQRGADELKVMVRRPLEERRSLADVENMRIRLPDGSSAPFRLVAQAEFGRGAASIRRRNRSRRVNVIADIDDGVANANEVVTSLEEKDLPALMREFPGVQYSLQGEQKQSREAYAGLRIGFLVALLSIFTLLAVPLRSYLQAVIIMLVIPFGYVGAVLGHFLTGVQMSFLSATGVMACAGVVVNDSLVLVTFLNRLRAGGMELEAAAVQAGQSRFRAIMLTSLTTFAGLTPIMLERSTQAQFVKPMAVSLAFGVLVATAFTLFLVPAAMVIAEDLRGGARRAAAKLSRPRPTLTGEPTLGA